MDHNSRASGFGIELLNQSNYKIYKIYLESYLTKDMVYDNTIIA